MERTLRENECYVQVELYSERIEELKDLLARFGYRFFAHPLYRPFFHQHGRY